MSGDLLLLDVEVRPLSPAAQLEGDAHTSLYVIIVLSDRHNRVGVINETISPIEPYSGSDVIFEVHSSAPSCSLQKTIGSGLMNRSCREFPKIVYAVLDTDR